ncbi:MAG: protein kinase [Verrucomicrobia bacterium]|nr:protein kinase [Verrucomicrobiota bacterium]
MTSDRTILEQPPQSPPVSGDVTILEQPPAHPSATARETAQRMGLPGPRTARLAAGEVRPPLLLMAGAEFRDYKLDRPIEASSAEADLWVLSHRQTGETAVLKLYRYGIQPKREILEALKFLRHSSVVRVIESGTTDGRSFEIQEFIAHGTLANAFGNGPLPPEQLRALLRELAEALADVHAAGIIHRDLKPSNILVRSREPLDIVLADFGISSFSDLSLHLSNANRTAAYAAPEAMTGVVTRTSDWWSIGVMMLELLRGEHPFAGLDERAINFTLVTRGIEVPASLPADWALLLRGLLTRDHQKRWSLDQVRAWLDGRRDLPVHEALDADAGATARVRAGYKFAGTEYFEPAALAGVLGSHWNDGVKQLARGYVQRWVEAQVGDEELAGILQDIADDDHLDAEQRLSAALLALDPALPLIWRGQVVDSAWLVAHATLPRPTPAAAASPVHPDDVPLLRLTKEIIREEGIATTAVIERRLDVSPGRARRLLDAMESRGCLGLDRGRHSREIRFDLHGGGGDLISEAALLLQSSLPAWLKRLRGQDWLAQAGEKRREAWRHFHTHRLPLLAELADQLLLSPHEGVVWTLVEERRRQFARSTDETLDRLLKQTDEISFAEAVALTAAEPGYFITQERELLTECIDWLNRLHFRYDRALAEQLILARDWELVGSHWNARHAEFGGAVPSALQAIFELADPEYLDAVAVACAERGLFFSRENQLRQDALASLDREHFNYDRELAAQLALAQDWAALYDRWAERRSNYVDATPAFLRRVLLCEKPEYLEVVALVTADRLHFRTEAQCETAGRLRERFHGVGRVAGWGATQANHSPTEVPPVCGQSIVAIAAGAGHSLALRDDGVVVAWGSNVSSAGAPAGQARVPAGLGEVIAIAAGHEHSLALRADGTVAAWGANTHGQCAVPSGLREIIAIAAGGQHSLALRADGKVVAWGERAHNACSVPKNLPPIIALAAGGTHTIALAKDGHVFAWGGDDCGQSSVPWLLGGVVAIAAGAQHSLALDDRGRVHAWGAGAKGEGRPPHCGQSALPSGLSGVTAIAAGAFHSLALADGKVVAWGDRRAVQTAVPFFAGAVLAVAGGGSHSLALIAATEETAAQPR